MDLNNYLIYVQGVGKILSDPLICIYFYIDVSVVSNKQERGCLAHQEDCEHSPSAAVSMSH